MMGPFASQAPQGPSPGHACPTACRAGCGQEEERSPAADLSGGPPEQQHSGSSERPITPQHAPTQAPCTPASSGVAASAATPARRAAASPRQQQRAAPAADAGPAQLQARLASFVSCVAGSPMVQSALLSLQLSGHPPAEGVAPAEGGSPAEGTAVAVEGVEWTLAQLLALFLRSGQEQACESALLAALWLLESTHSALRSPASLCLSSYIRHLQIFSPKLVAKVTANWPATFVHLRAALVEAQAELLEHLNWHLRLDLHRDVRPCHTLLFSPPAAACAGLEGPGAPLSATLQHMCEGIRHWALLVQGEERKRQAAGPDTPAVSSGGQHVGGKRQRRDT